MALQLFLFDLRGSADMLLREATVASEEQTTEEINQVSSAAPQQLVSSAAPQQLTLSLCSCAGPLTLSLCSCAGPLTGGRLQPVTMRVWCRCSTLNH